MGGTWKSSEMPGREFLGCWKYSFMGDSGGSSEDQNANRNPANKDCAHARHQWLTPVILATQETEIRRI
jgi:hypothetical protein